MNNQPLGELIDAQFELRLQKYKLATELKEIEQQMEDMEQRIIATMEVLGTDTGRTQKATATITAYKRYNVANYDTLINWILESPAERIYLFERRLLQSATKELMELDGECLPGTVLFEKPKISLTKRS